MFFNGFDEWDLKLDTGVTVHGRSGGSGPAVVLLHGHPRAHTTWHGVAPRLVDAGFSVVTPDLRGYGRSSKPEPDEAHEVYCDRSMAADVAELMTRLGHETFAVVGHDRGQGVASRLAFDHPGRVERLAILDGVPILEAAERTDLRFAKLWWHWWFFSDSPHAERVVNADPDAWYRLDRAQMGEENYAYVNAAIHDPRTVRAMIEDYRAGLSIDLDHERADRESGNKVTCPLLVGWSLRDDMEELYGDPSLIWRDWASGPITTAKIDSGHHMAEENPEQLAEALIGFLRG